MTLLQFMSESPFLTFFLCYMFIEYAFKVWNRLMRHLNIRSKGWPPAHLDADGDFKEEEKDEKESRRVGGLRKGGINSLHSFPNNCKLGVTENEQPAANGCSQHTMQIVG